MLSSDLEMLSSDLEMLSSDLEMLNSDLERQPSAEKGNDYDVPAVSLDTTPTGYTGLKKTSSDTSTRQGNMTALVSELNDHYK